MSLTVGVRLGPFEILSPLGAGGMGEVYRAMDTNHRHHPRPREGRGHETPAEPMTLVVNWPALLKK